MPVSSSVVTSYYQAIMRATPTSAQVAALSTLADTTALTNTLLGSANNSVDPLIRVYQAAFGRVPDSSGLDYWVGVYNAGGNSVASLQAITAGFAGSTEFRNAYDALDNRGYVSALYANVLGRAGDAAGIDYWVGVLGSGVARSTVLREFASSAEFKATTDSLIDSFLSSAAAGTQSYSGSLLAGGGGAGRDYALTTDVEGVSGSAGNDTITGVIGASGTYNVGDTINGGLGSDTLVLTDAGSATAAGYAELNAVETVAVRMLSAGTTIINANGWSGVSTISNASSLAGSTLTVTGAESTSTIKVYGDSDVNVDYRNATTANATISLVSVGTGNTATTIGSASAAATANIDLDLDNSGLIAAVNIAVEGSVNLARVEAGSNVTAYSVTGAGNLAIVTDDTITTFNAAAASGNVDVTFQGASDVTVTGGLGNDTFRFGTTYNNNDSVNGGNGTDTIAFTIGGFNRNLNATNVERAEITFADAGGGDVSLASASMSTVNLLASSASADGSISEIASNTTVNITASAAAFDQVTIDGRSGASNLTLNVGSASGNVGIDNLTITDISSVVVNSVTGTANNAGTLTISTAVFDEDLRSLTVNAVAGTGAVAFDFATAGGATAITINSQGSAGITLGTGISGSALTTLTVLNSGSANIVLEEVEGTALNSITLDANGGGNIYLAGGNAGSGIELGNGGSGGSVVSASVFLKAETNSDVGTAASGASGVIINTTGAIALNVNVESPSASGGVHVGVVTVALGNATAETTNASVNVSAGSIGSNSIIRLEKINIDGMTGTQVNVAATTVGASATFVLASGGIDADGVDNVDVSALNLTLAASAIVEVGAITTTGGMVNSISLTAADGASATFGAIRASGVGAMSFTVASGASATLGNIAVSASGAIGSIEVNGADVGGVTFGTLSASAVGSILISGAANLTIGTVTTNRIGTIDARNHGVSGALTVDLSGVSAAAEVYLGAATNLITSGKGNDVITLKAGTTGNDTVVYSTALQATDSIVNFRAGTLASGGGDVIALGTGIQGGIAVGSAIVTDASTFALATASANAAISVASTGAEVNAILIQATAFASTAAMMSAISTGGSLEIGAGTGESTAGSIVVVWTDGSDSYVSLISVTAGLSGADAIVDASAVSTLAVVSGVSPAAFVAANFDFV